MEAAQRGLGRGVFDAAPWPRLRGVPWSPTWGHVGSTTEQGGAKVNHGTLDLARDAKAQIQSCAESCSVGQGADTALSGRSWVQIPCAFQGVCVALFHMCWPVGRDPSNRQ